MKYEHKTRKYETGNIFFSFSDWTIGYALKIAFLALFSSAGLTVANAQIQFPVGLPTPKVGDIAKYQTVDLWNNSELSNSISEVVEISADRFVTRVRSSARTEPFTLNFTREWQPCRALLNSNDVVCAGSFKFPMQVGGKHAYEKLPWPNGNGINTSTCEVKSEEKVTVPAGTFDAIRIECSGFWTRIFGGTRSGRQTEMLWYAPSISRLVKSQYFDFNGSSAFNKNQTELIEFTAAK